MADLSRNRWPVIFGTGGRNGSEQVAEFIGIHKIDPVVDEARLYVGLDLLFSRYPGRFGYTKGVGYDSLDMFKK
ncbi:MAG: hypothetical protein U9N19_04760 [Thermodesulfobacteriota bacterium]|nr:hypothetical protein [Thermodesulfobacteriota bacterium]